MLPSPPSLLAITTPGTGQYAWVSEDEASVTEWRSLKVGDRVRAFRRFDPMVIVDLRLAPGFGPEGAEAVAVVRDARNEELVLNARQLRKL
jgi:hypothetical protein